MTALLHKGSFLILATFCLFLVQGEPLTVKICVPYPEVKGAGILNKCTNAAKLADTDDLTFECVPGGSADECIALIENGEAHLTTLDGADVLTANPDHGIVPLIVEKREDDVEGGRYYAVAVVNKNFCDETTDLSALKDTRSCHTGYRKAAGWTFPVGVLLQYADDFATPPTEEDIEDDAEVVANFFSEVCAPQSAGAGAQINEEGEREVYEPLCTACKGDCSTNDQYYDYSGAFRCLMEGAGDVAFVKHTTVLDYAQDGNLDEVFHRWADKNMEDFQLLCADGCMDVTEYEECHLAVAPGRAMVTSEALLENGENSTGLAVQAAILAAASGTNFLNESVSLTNNFLWSKGTTSLEAVESGMRGYLPPESAGAFVAYESITEAAANSPTPSGIYCATSAEELEFCESMVDIMNVLGLAFGWGCVQLDSVQKCMEAIYDEAADWMTVSPLQAYEALTRFNLEAIAAEEGALGDGYSYYSIALVKKEFCDENEDAILDDLKGKNSCHTGYRRNAGWEMAIGKMVALDIMDPVKKEPSVANDAETAASFFDNSCAPNREGEGPVRGKNNTFEEYTPLCSACDESCDEESPYFGYEGAHRCLADDAGDVAFVKHTTPTDFADVVDPEDLRLICPSRRGCAPVDDYEECNLGKVPARAVIVRDQTVYTERFKETLLTIAAEDDFKDLVLNEDNNPEEYVFRSTPSIVGLDEGTRRFLDTTFEVYEALDNLAAPGGEVVKICVPFDVSEGKIQECTEIFAAANVTGIEFECVFGGDPETCMQQLYNGESHLTALDGGDVFRGHELYGIVPLIREVGEDGIDGTYYSVAVVNADFCDGDTTLASLEGMRSCHTGYRKMAGWRIPVGTLLTEVDAFSAPVTRVNVEDDAELVARFFADVCAPRVSGNGPQNTENGEGAPWSRLCSACKGDCSIIDQYYDYSGAFRCLVEGMGDVAFVKHTTVPDYAFDGRLDRVFRYWNEKPSSDFKLLCRSGGCADVEDYRECHLALVPSHAIVGAPSFGEDEALYELGRVIQEGIVDGSRKRAFFSRARGFVSDFPFSSETESLLIVEGGYEGYITPAADDTLKAFSELTNSDRISNPGNLATFCATTEAQFEACEHNVKHVYRKIEPDFNWDCILEESIEDCYEAIEKGIAQFTTASPKQALQGLESHDLTVIAAEAIGPEKETEVHSLLVIDEKDCNDEIFIFDLEGQDICFSEYGSDSGWEVPLSVMISQGLLSKVKNLREPTNAMQSASDFFGDVCAPHDPSSEFASETLCEACQGECEVTSDFAGPGGAVRCMKSKEGAVAVTDSTIAFDRDTPQGIQLLCPFKRGCYDVAAYETCNFGIVPTDAILVSGTDDTSYISRLRSTLVRASNNRRHRSILHNTRDSGELVSITGGIQLYLFRYSSTLETFSDFENGSK